MKVPTMKTAFAVCLGSMWRYAHRSSIVFASGVATFSSVFISSP